MPPLPPLAEAAPEFSGVPCQGTAFGALHPPCPWAGSRRLPQQASPPQIFLTTGPMGAPTSSFSFFPSLRNLLLLLSLALPLLSSPVQAQGSIGDSVSTFMIEENLRHFLGLGVNIVQKNVPDYTYSYGFQDNTQETPFTDSTLFNLGSVSKLFTAIAIVSLAEQGYLNLDDPVYTHFPEFLEINGHDEWAPSVRIIDLLQHHSGLTQSMEHLFPEKFDKTALKSEDEFYENTFNYRAFLSMEDFRNRFLMYARLDHKPGKDYHFSNLNYVLLGYILEEVTGMNLGEYVTNALFVPLKMHDSHYITTPKEWEGRLARGYYRLQDGSYLNVHGNEVESPSPTGDGGIRTSLRDMRKFMHFLVGDLVTPAYEKILPRQTLVTMTAPMKGGPDRKTRVGIGFHNIQPYNFSGHTGGWDGFLAILYYHPESHSCLFLITNREDNELFLFLRVYAAYAMEQRQR